MPRTRHTSPPRVRRQVTSPDGLSLAVNVAKGGRLQVSVDGGDPKFIDTAHEDAIEATTAALKLGFSMGKSVCPAPATAAVSFAGGIYPACGATVETACEATYERSAGSAPAIAITLLVRTPGGGYYGMGGVCELCAVACAARTPPAMPACLRGDLTRKRSSVRSWPIL